MQGDREGAEQVALDGERRDTVAPTHEKRVPSQAPHPHAPAKKPSHSYLYLRTRMHPRACVPQLLVPVERAHVTDVLVLGVVGLPVVDGVLVALAGDDGELLTQLLKGLVDALLGGEGDLHDGLALRAAGEVGQQAGG